MVVASVTNTTPGMQFVVHRVAERQGPRKTRTANRPNEEDNRG